jgi:predicted TIM-barrel fold metal-dependent hydrolase
MWKRKGSRVMIVDIHTHYRFPRFAQNPEAYLDKEPFAAYCASNPKHRERSVDEILAAADEAGVDWVGLQGSGFINHATCVELNDYGLESLAKNPGRLLVFASIQPKAGDLALKEFRRCVDGGMVGVGELNPDGQGFALDDPDFLAIAGAAVDMEVPLLLHFNETVGHEYPGKGKVPLEDLYEFIQKFPTLQLIVAHWGGGLPYFELMPEVRAACRNVYYDTAASPLLYEAPIFPITVQLVGSRKILFGSDFPLICFPEEQVDPDFGRFLRHVRESGLDPESVADVLGGNAVRLFGL